MGCASATCSQCFLYFVLSQTVGSAADWAASLNAARESVTLLKNAGGTLPLKASQKVLLVGMCIAVLYGYLD